MPEKITLQDGTEREVPTEDEQKTATEAVEKLKTLEPLTKKIGEY